jgi:hypothetical protein
MLQQRQEKAQSHTPPVTMKLALCAAFPAVCVDVFGILDDMVKQGKIRFYGLVLES